MSALAPTTGVKNRKGGGPGAARRGKRLRRAGRAGFARLSGWQPIGNWVVSAANFPASQLPIGVTPTTSRESRRAVCAEKWPEAQAERDSAYHRKAENHLRGGGSFLSSAPGRAAPSTSEVGFGFGGSKAPRLQRRGQGSSTPSLYLTSGVAASLRAAVVFAWPHAGEGNPESGAAGKAAPDIASLIRATTTLDVGFAAGGGRV